MEPETETTKKLKRVVSHSRAEKDPAAIQKIVHTFATGGKDIKRVQALILAHEHFVTSDTLLEAIFIEFRAVKPDDQINQCRVINFLKRWITLERGKFINTTEGIGKNLDLFIQSNELPDNLRKSLQSALSDESAKTGLDDDEEESFGEIPPVITKKKKKVPTEVLAYDPEEIARQLTLIDQRNISEIDLKELLKQCWLKKGKSPTLNKVADRVQSLALWVAYEILVCRPKYRSDVFLQFIRIAEELLLLQNYQSLMGIFLGLNLAPISKLFTSLMDQLSPLVQDIYDEFAEILSYNNNYIAYRETIRHATYPWVPCQEIFLKDLLYHDESYPNYTEDGLVDYSKLRIMGNIINDFRKCQITKYNLDQFKELYEYLLNIRTDITIESLEMIDPVTGSDPNSPGNVSNASPNPSESTNDHSDSTTSTREKFTVKMNLNLTKLKGGGGKDSPRGANKITDRKLLTVPNDSESLTDSSGKRSPTSKAAAFFNPNSAKSPRKDTYSGDISEKSEREEKKEEKKDKDKTEKKSKLSKLGKSSSSPKDKKEKK